MNNNTQNKIFIFLERLWLFSAALSVIAVVYFLVTKDNDSALYWFGFFILSGLLYLMRKRQRVRFQQQMQQNNGGYEPGKKS
jgi:hypothetical protein